MQVAATGAHYDPNLSGFPMIASGERESQGLASSQPTTASCSQESDSNTPGWDGNDSQNTAEAQLRLMTGDSQVSQPSGQGSQCLQHQVAATGAYDDPNLTGFPMIASGDGDYQGVASSQLMTASCSQESDSNTPGWDGSDSQDTAAAQLYLMTGDAQVSQPAGQGSQSQCLQPQASYHGLNYGA